MMRLRRAALLAATLATAAACQILVGIEDDRFTVATPDAGPDGDAPASPPDLCAHSRLPPPPGPSDAGTARTYVFAVDSFELPGRDASATPGFDLDRVCTCFDGGPTAHDAAPSCTSRNETTACDEPGGVDNSLANLYRQFSALGAGVGVDVIGQIEAQQTENINCGKQTGIFVLRDYNGTPNDDDVLLGPVISHGIRETLDGAPGAPGPGCGEELVEGGALAPKHDGTDVWSHTRDTLQRSSTFDDPIPLVMLSGYVTNFRLVISYDDDQHKLPVPFLRGTISVGTPIVTAELVPLNAQGERIHLGPDGAPESPPHAFALENGVLGGRAQANDIVAAMGRMPFAHDPDGGSILGCTTALFPALRELTCGSVDIPSLARNDFASRPCDAFSVMFQFHAGPAYLYGEHTYPDPDAASCPPDFGACPP